MEPPEESPVVRLGPLREYVESRLHSGAYASLEELIHAALEALQREETAAGEWVKQVVDGAPAKSKLRTNRGEEIHEVRSFCFRREDRDF